MSHLAREQVTHLANQMSIGAHSLLFTPQPLPPTFSFKYLLIRNRLFVRNSAENADLNHRKILKLSLQYFHLGTHWHLKLVRPSQPAPPRHNCDFHCVH